MAVEPSALMIEQRPVDAAPVVEGVAEQLPFDDDRFAITSPKRCTITPGECRR
jgi:hypothetical protein